MIGAGAVHKRMVKCTIVIYRMNEATLVLTLQETKFATMNIFSIFLIFFKSFVKAELSYVITINLFTIAEN